MQSRRGGGPHPPAVNLRPDQRADVGIGPYVVQEAERYPQDCRGGACPRHGIGAGGHKGRPYIWRERYHCRNVAAGVHTRPRSICGRIGGPMWASAPTLFRRRIDTRRTVGAGLVPARVSLAPAAEEKEDAHAGGVRVLLV